MKGWGRAIARPHSTKSRGFWGQIDADQGIRCVDLHCRPGRQRNENRPGLGQMDKIYARPDTNQSRPASAANPGCAAAASQPRKSACPPYPDRRKARAQTPAALALGRRAVCGRSRCPLVLSALGPQNRHRPDRDNDPASLSRVLAVNGRIAALYPVNVSASVDRRRADCGQGRGRHRRRG